MIRQLIATDELDYVQKYFPILIFFLELNNNNIEYGARSAGKIYLYRYYLTFHKYFSRFDFMDFIFDLNFG